MSFIDSFFKGFTNHNRKIETITSTDLHSHILPGIDDGVQNIEESIEIIKLMKRIGYKKMIATPHIMYDAYGNTKTSILKSLENFTKLLKKHGVEMHIEAAAEYYLDEGFLKLLDKKEVLTVGESYLLFETSYVQKPSNLEKAIFMIEASGFIPLLAHPERYRYIKTPSYYKHLKSLGVYFQVNLNSFCGAYGKHAQKMAKYLAREKMIDFIGSDIHGIKHAELLQRCCKKKDVTKLLRYNTLLNDTL